MSSQAVDIPGVQADSAPPHAERAAAAEAAAQQLLAEEEREAAKAAAKKSKKQKQKVKKQLQQQQQQLPSTPEDAGSPTTSDHEQYSDGLEGAVTAGDSLSAEAGGISPRHQVAQTSTLITQLHFLLIQKPHSVFQTGHCMICPLLTHKEQQACIQDRVRQAWQMHLMLKMPSQAALRLWIWVTQGR